MLPRHMSMIGPSTAALSSLLPSSIFCKYATILSCQMRQYPLAKCNLKDIPQFTIPSCSKSIVPGCLFPQINLCSIASVMRPSHGMGLGNDPTWQHLTASHWWRSLTSLRCLARNSIANPRWDQNFSATHNQCIELVKNCHTIESCSCWDSYILVFFKSFSGKEFYEIWSFCWHFKSSSQVSQDVLLFYFFSSSLLHSYHFGRDTYCSATPDFSK